MARILENRTPIDSVARKAVGFGFPLNGPAVFVPTYTTREQTKANLINYLLTNRGERVFNPTFGADLRNLVFENIVDVTSDELQERIQNDISTYFPQVIVQEIKFDNIPDSNTINFTLTYNILNFGITDDIQILLQ
jgi:phage baseplate assembly protein W|tara:strand:- start:12165 stop:12572 length:408 start_codon:yes stop_codon:yes gene_type:complete